MKPIQTLFSGAQKEVFKELARRLANVTSTNPDINLKAREIYNVINVFLQNADQIDQYCQQNIKWVGSSLIAQAMNLSDPATETEQLDEIFAILLRFVIEFDLSIKGDLSSELQSIQKFAKSNLKKFTARAQDQIRYSWQEMSVGILKQLLNQDEIGNIRNISEYCNEINHRFETWETSLSTHESTIKSLQDSLKSYETAFNFVGLYDGFKDLANDKKTELFWLRFWMVLFGALVVCPLLTEMYNIYTYREQLSSTSSYFLVSTALISLSLTGLLIYFFRIFLRGADSCKAQLLQIELRKTLCRFIQSYANYSKELKEKNAESLSKFESIIFSGIVSNGEKLPSTFDGIDQVANIISAIKKT